MTPKPVTDVHDGEDREVAAGDRAAPQQGDRDDEAGEGEEDGEDGDAAFKSSHELNVDEHFQSILDRRPRSLPKICCMSDKSGTQRLPPELLALWVPQLPVLAEEIIAVDPHRGAAVRPPAGRRLRTDGARRRRGGAAPLQRTRADGVRPGGVRSVYVALGRGEAREGRSLESLLAAYRVGVLVAWRRLGQTAVAAGLSGDALVGIAESLFAYIDQLSAESAEGFAAEQAVRAGECRPAARQS